MPAAIEIKDLRKTYTDRKSGKAKQALKGINLTVPRGSFFGLLGPNGAGKSTLINILSGLVLKTSGEASICGHNIDTDTRAARYAIGVVPQELVLDPFFPVYEALENHAGYYGIPKAKRRTQEIIDAVGLTEQARTAARKLSGGMKRRLLVAKALVHSPDVLILDEPTAGVDVELREQLWDYVRELNANGTTILLTTHYLEEAEELCDEIAVINHGELVAHDRKEVLLGLMDRKQVVITVAQKLDAVPECFSAMQCEILDAHKLRVTYKAAKHSFNDILEASSSCGLTITDISTEDIDLEDIFRHLTRKAA